MRIFVLVLSLLLLSVILSLSCDTLTHEQRVQIALENLAQKSPRDGEIMSQIALPVSWRIGDHKGATLATTTVTYDRIYMVFDVAEARKRNERLEPIISHEIFHAYDATVNYGIEGFISQVEKDKSKPWAERKVEISAVAHEDSTRKWLLTHYPTEFEGMSPHRIR